MLVRKLMKKNVKSSSATVLKEISVQIKGKEERKIRK
jgi:hypothetical protein